MTQDQRIKKLEKTLYPSIEKKSRDVRATVAPISSSGYNNQPMFQLEQGDEKNQRVGDKVCLTEHRFKCLVKKADGNNLMRIILAVTPSTTALSIGSVLEYGNYTTDAEQVFISPYKRVPSTAENTYQILYDKVVNLNDDQASFEIDKRIKCGKYGKQVSFNSAGSVMPENYHLCLLAISDSTAASHPTISYVLRSKYTDL
jgi:hypothetical protein